MLRGCADRRRGNVVKPAPDPMVMTSLPIDGRWSAAARRPIMRPRAAVGPALLMPQRSDSHPLGCPAHASPTAWSSSSRSSCSGSAAATARPPITPARRPQGPHRNPYRGTPWEQAPMGTPRWGAHAAHSPQRVAGCGRVPGVGTDRAGARRRHDRLELAGGTHPRLGQPLPQAGSRHGAGDGGDRALAQPCPRHRHAPRLICVAWVRYRWDAPPSQCP